MKGTKPSRTAQGVAAQRAVLTDSGVIADPYARGMLTPSMAALVRVVQRLPRVQERSLTLAGFAVRVRWIDAEVAAALDAGIGQVAVVGAGYDSRAWRFGRDGVRFTMYLDEQIVCRHLRDLAAASAHGSRMVVDFLPARGSGTSRQQQRQEWFRHLARAGSGELSRLRLDRPEAVALVEASGWHADEVSLRTRSAPSSRPSPASRWHRSTRAARCWSPHASALVAAGRPVGVVAAGRLRRCSRRSRSTYEQATIPLIGHWSFVDARSRSRAC